MFTAIKMHKLININFTFLISATFILECKTKKSYFPFFVLDLPSIILALNFLGIPNLFPRFGKTNDKPFFSPYLKITIKLGVNNVFHLIFYN